MCCTVYLTWWETEPVSYVAVRSLRVSTALMVDSWFPSETTGGDAWT